MSSFSDTGDGGMKALQDELKSLLEHQQQRQKPVSFDPSSFQYPF